MREQPIQHRRRRREFSALKKRDFETKLFDLARVTRVAAGGKHFRFRAVVIAGDKKGKVGVGTAKGRDVAQAIEKATRKAEKNFFLIPLKRDTIPFEVEAKFGASLVMLKPQREGRGLVAGGAARAICELGGVKNICAKFLSRSGNKLNNAMAVMTALNKLKSENRRSLVPNLIGSTESSEAAAEIPPISSQNQTLKQNEAL